MVNLIKRRILLGILISSVSLLAGACGPGTPSASQIVSDVQLKTFQKDSDDWVQAKVSINTGGFQLSGANIPVMDPRNPSVQYGELTIVPTLCSNCSNFSGEIIAGINISKVSPIEGVAPILPNGTALPVGGLQNARVVALPVSKNDVTDAYLYFAFGPNVAMLGTAVSFSAMDPAGAYVPGVNYFQPIKAGPVNLLAGIYAGAAPRTTGIGFFIDLSGVVNNTNAPRSLHSLVASRSGEFKSSLVMKPVSPSEKKKQKLLFKLWELNQKHLILDLHK